MVQDRDSHSVKVICLLHDFPSALFLQLRSSWQDFNRCKALHGPCAISDHLCVIVSSLHLPQWRSGVNRNDCSGKLSAGCLSVFKHLCYAFLYHVILYNLLMMLLLLALIPNDVIQSPSKKTANFPAAVSKSVKYVHARLQSQSCRETTLIDKQLDWWQTVFKTRGSAIVEGPSDAWSQLKFYHLLHSCRKSHTWDDLQQGMTLKFAQGYWK